MQICMSHMKVEASYSGLGIDNTGMVVSLAGKKTIRIVIDLVVR